MARRGSVMGRIHGATAAAADAVDAVDAVDAADAAADAAGYVDAVGAGAHGGDTVVDRTITGQMGERECARAAVRYVPLK